MDTPTENKTEATEEVAPAKPEATAPKTAAKKSDKKLYMVIGGVLAVVVLLAILSSILGHKATKTIGGVTVNGNGSAATIKTANGDEITTGTQSLPKDFPSSVPVYKGTITQGTRLTTDGKVSWSVVVTTSDSATKVTDSLSQSFSTNGWTTSLDNKTADGGLIAATNGDLHTQVITVAKDGKTSISYVVVTIPQQ